MDASIQSLKPEASDLLPLRAVNFYEVLADGYHSPLTKTQIAELFQAGRLSRKNPCKPLRQKKWQTIDELFPLLKYQSAWPASYYSPETDARSARTHIVIFCLLVAALLAAASWYFFASRGVERIDRPPVTVRDWPKTVPSAPTSITQQTADIPSTAPVTVYAPPAIVEGVHETNYAAPRTIDSQQVQLAAQRRQSEQQQQQQREQTERERVRAERENSERKAAGHDVIIPLDEDTVVSHRGMSVRVKIHDNDVTSFDVWINGARYREVPKQKGITGSRADETLIYASSNAHLYYVWELSGKLNHCRLRVRED